MQTGDSAESVVRMTLQGSEVFLRIGGAAAKNIAIALYALSKEKRNTKGKANLKKMLNTNKECKVFSINESELKTFDKQANAYGVMYCALVNRKEKSKDGMVDIMVKAEDGSKVNRIISRFNLSSIDRATIKSEAQRDIEKGQAKTNHVPKSQGELKKSQSKNSSKKVEDIETSKKPSVKAKLKSYKENQVVSKVSEKVMKSPKIDKGR